MIYLLILLISGCASREHMREDLQNRNPGCFVAPDLTMLCPDPFLDFDLETKRMIDEDKDKK